MQLHANKKIWFLALSLLVFGGNAWLLNTGNRLTAGGHAIPEYPLLVDITVTLPLAYYLLFRPSIPAFLVRLLALLSFGLAFGSYVIPQHAKHVWLNLAILQPWLGGLLAAIEAGVMLVLTVSLWRLLRLSDDADVAIEQGLMRHLGNTPFVPVLRLEARAWFYGLALRHPSRLRFRGDQHFFSARNQGNASNQFGFICLILFETPLLHLVLHFVWSPLAAGVVTALTLYSLLYLVADYRATLVRPVSLTADSIIVRCGVLAADVEIPLSAVAKVVLDNSAARRQRGVRRYHQMGAVNVVIHLHEGTHLPGLFGKSEVVHRVCLGLDEPQAFVRQLGARLAH